MKHSDWKTVEILRLFAVLHWITLCRAAISASPNCITKLPTGEDIRFPINHYSDEKHEVTFRRRSPIRLKIMAWKSDRPERPYVTHPYYRHRVQFHKDGFFELQNVQLYDGGMYEIQTDYLGKQLRNKDRDPFDLWAFEPVSRPVVVITGNCSSNFKLNCSTARGTNVTHRWEKQSAHGVSTYTFNGAVLQLGNTSEQEPHTYTCIVENPVSKETSDPVTAELCDGERARGPRSHWIAVLILAIALVILVPAIVLGIWRSERIGKSKQSRGGIQGTEEQRNFLRGGETEPHCGDAGAGPPIPV
ncbi:SLAM family member 9-like [Heptranchias perlo]|uniref:SLAM family member 9-like n=1 Tax=Heptranchias perlo TaxID=212740 RepID=UPI003559DC28